MMLICAVSVVTGRPIRWWREAPGSQGNQTCTLAPARTAATRLQSSAPCLSHHCAVTRAKLHVVVLLSVWLFSKCRFRPSSFQEALPGTPGLGQVPHPAPPSATHRVSTTHQAPRGPDLPISGGDQSRKGCLQQVLGCCLLFRESKVVCLGGLGLPPGMDSAIILFGLLHNREVQSPNGPVEK